MTRRVKIAVIAAASGGSADAAAVSRDLRQLPGPPEVRDLDDLYGDFDALRDFAPDLLLVPHERLATEDVGVLRLLAHAHPGVWFVLITSAAREVEADQLARRVDARVLVAPCRRADLLALLALPGSRTAGARPGAFLDLIRGISDEINNPLLFVTGHLQLVDEMLDRERDRAAKEQLAAMREGLARIAATMDKIRLLTRADVVGPPMPTMQLGALLAAVWEPAKRGKKPKRKRRRPDVEPAAAPPPLLPRVPDRLRSVTVAADERLLPDALRAFRALVEELAARSAKTALSVDHHDDGVRIRVELSGLEVDEWQLPRTFEPYYINRFLRGTTHGLGLFIVQTVLSAHGGHATASRRADETLVIDLWLAPPT